MHWSLQYIGLPYLIGGRDRAGLDCWGLLRLFYQEQKQIILPELPGVVEDGTLHLAREILFQSFASWKRIDRPVEGCAVAMSQRYVLHHVGIWTEADGGKVVHSWQAPVVADRLRSLQRQRGIRRLEFYEYGFCH